MSRSLIFLVYIFLRYSLFLFSLRPSPHLSHPLCFILHYVPSSAPRVFPNFILHITKSFFSSSSHNSPHNSSFTASHIFFLTFHNSSLISSHDFWHVSSPTSSQISFHRSSSPRPTTRPHFALHFVLWFNCILCFWEWVGEKMATHSPDVFSTWLE